MPRFSIKQMMIGVGVVAALLWIYRTFTPASFALSIISLAMSLKIKSDLLKYPRFALWVFAFAAFFGIVPMGLLCACCYDLFVVMLLFVNGLVATAIVLGSGLAWVGGRKEGRRWTRVLRWGIVLILGLMPLSMVITPWPLHLAFALSRSAMDRIADRVRNGGKVNAPEWAGFYEIVGAVQEPSNGNVALLIDDDSAGRVGFVRLEGGPKAFGPLINFRFDEPVGGSWRYQVED